MKSIIGAYKAKKRLKRVKKRAYKHFSPKLTSHTIAGMENYNKEQRTLKKLIYKKNDIIGAYKYVKQQRAKLHKQRSSIKKK